VNLDGFALPVKKLKGTDTVETLDLSGKNLGVASAVVIASLISVNGGLTKLSLAVNRLGEEGTKAICKALEQNTTLKELDISHSEIGGSAGAKDVAKMVGVNGGLTALNLSSNSLKDEGVNAVCEAIQSNKETKLASLNFSYNSIGPVGANAVAAMVAVTGSLTKIDVSWNIFGPEGAKVFADALLVNGALTALNLSSNDIGSHWDYDQDEIVSTPEGPKAIADALLVNGALTALDLSSNDLKDEGVCAVCEAIQSNKETKLASLNFKNNGIGPGGANAVAAMVAVTGALTKME
jgi:NLR family CARD domain-containing protein 3